MVNSIKQYPAKYYKVGQAFHWSTADVVWQLIGWLILPFRIPTTLYACRLPLIGMAVPLLMLKPVPCMTETYQCVSSRVKR